MASVSIGYLESILELIADHGVSRNDCLNAVDLKGLPVNAPKYRLPFEKVDAIIAFAAKKLNQPLLGIILSKKFRISQYSELGNILALCNDIEHAAEVNARYANLVHSIGNPTGIIKGEKNGYDKIRWTPNYPAERYNDHRQISECVMTNYVTSVDYLAWSFGKGVVILRLAHQPVTDVKVYRDIFGCEVEFNAEEYAVILKKDVAKQPIPTANPSKFALFQAKQEKILASYMQRDNLVFRVERQIRETIELEKPLQKNVAASLGLSERSMRRFLAEQNTSFKAIMESIKKDLARIKISEGQPLSDIAQSLWYSDQAAFTRAYKKWHGVSPGRHRAA